VPKRYRLGLAIAAECVAFAQVTRAFVVTLFYTIPWLVRPAHKWHKVNRIYQKTRNYISANKIELDKEN